MSPIRVPLKAVLYKEQGTWIAHCLEFDLIGDGETKEQALDVLTDAILVQIHATIKYKNPANLFKPAEGRYFRMFAEGKKIGTSATGELRIEFKQTVEPIEIEDFEAREYSDTVDEAEDSDCLVPA